MSRDGEKYRSGDLVGINWGSSNFRAWRISPGGVLVDELTAPRGVASLDRPGMVDMMAQVAARWPDLRCPLATGMIGSNVGWIDVPYVDCPVSAADIARRMVPTTIGVVDLLIAPGLACRRVRDDQPDILRGEDIEIFGALALDGNAQDRLLVLPGTHTKWARTQAGRLVDFFTSMSGEVYDRLTAQGLLASVVEGDAHVGEAFMAGLSVTQEGLGLCAALFGVRARVIRGDLARQDAASYLRGILIGAEFVDAAHLYPNAIGSAITLVGNASLSTLYRAAAPVFGHSATIVDARAAGIAGFLAVERARAVTA